MKHNLLQVPYIQQPRWFGIANIYNTGISAVLKVQPKQQHPAEMNEKNHEQEGYQRSHMVTNENPHMAYCVCLILSIGLILE